MDEQPVTRARGAATRDRIVVAAMDLLRLQGLAGTGIKQIGLRARAPLGSIYHFFPGGKDELAQEALRRAGAAYAAQVNEVFEAVPDVAAAVETGFAGAAATLVASDYADACPIATVALEVASTNDALRRATEGVFTGWIDALTARFRAAGIAPERSRELAWAFLSALEGAFVLARALRSTEPVTAAGDFVAAAVRSALADGFMTVSGEREGQSTKPVSRGSRHVSG